MSRLLRKTAAGLLSLFLTSSSWANLDSAAYLVAAGDQSPLITAPQAEAIYKRLVTEHWVPKTGLFISFLGTQDRKLSQQASTYEQAAAGLLALRVGDRPRADALFEFLRTAWAEGPMLPGREDVHGFANFYNAEFGGPGIEKTIHVGPNAWAGLFVAAYANQTGNPDAQLLALDMARWMIKDIPHRDGGIAMGPIDGMDGIPWPQIYSTENNVSYYGFLSELLRAKSLDWNDRLAFSAERGRIENWLVGPAFDRLAYSMNRGANPHGYDRMRALDTYTWLVSAVGPARLREHGVDADRLMRQAADYFEVSVGGLRGVDSTDQPEADLTYSWTGDELVSNGTAPRPGEDQHRMIWYEGLGQYINALNQMAAYCDQAGQHDRTAYYSNKARQFADAFDQAALNHGPAGSAFAYATPGKFFHDGWYTPKPAKDGPPNSLIASVWRCYAGLGFDPLAGVPVASVPAVAIAPFEIKVAAHRTPDILFGTSDDMVIQAWHQLEFGNTDRAIEQAQATIDEWSPWARQLQQRKAVEVGRLIDYTGMPEQRKEIFSYWALNDVGAAYFVQAKAFDQQNHYTRAAQALAQITSNYSLAQIWDPHGWFWSPVDAVADEFVGRDPRHYGEIIPPMLASSPSLGKLPN
jgi:hypothetical protein